MSFRCHFFRRWFSYQTCASEAIRGARLIACRRSNASNTNSSNVSDNSSATRQCRNSNSCSGSSSGNTMQWHGASIHIRAPRHRRMCHSSRDSGNIVMPNHLLLMWHERETLPPRRRTAQRRHTRQLALGHRHTMEEALQCAAIHRWCPRLCRVHRDHQL